MVSSGFVRARQAYMMQSAAKTLNTETGVRTVESEAIKKSFLTRYVVTAEEKNTLTLQCSVLFRFFTFAHSV